MKQITLRLIAFGMMLVDFQVHAEVGRTPGQFSVSPTGAAQYTIPIFAPPGPRGIQPQISLSYSSQSSIGPLGIGWAIGGLSSISRCNKTVAQDSVASEISFGPNGASDGYCLDGKRLRLTSAAGTYGASGSTYQTEIADFSNITASGQTGFGPSYFTVQAKNGLTYYYGYTDANGNGSGSQVLFLGPRLVHQSVGQWLLSKVVDRSGNNYVVNYTTLTSAAVPSQILWTPTSASGYAYSMTFNYPTGGGNTSQSSIYAYVGGAQIVDTNLLSSITVSYGSTVVKTYTLTYQASPTTGRERLSKVTECVDSGGTNCLSPTTISYQDGAAGLSTSSQSFLSGITGKVLTHYDLNGDGYPDLVYVAGGLVYVAWGSSSGYSASNVTNTGIASTALGPVGDLFGSGQDGILFNSAGTWRYMYWGGTAFASFATGASYSGANTALADVDGDGRPDLVTWSTTSTSLTFSTQMNASAGGTITFQNATASGSIACGNQALSCTFVVWTPDTAGPGRLRSWDFTGDGTDDLAVSETDTGGGTEFYEVLTAASSFRLTQVFSNTALTTPFVGDFNNDGCDDVVFDGFIEYSGCDGAPPIASVSISGTPVAVIDWDGDGRADLLVNTGSPQIQLSTGNNVSTPQSVSLSCGGIYLIADFNGDGLDDYGCLNGSITYALHNGANTPPDLLISIADGYGNSASPSYISITQGSYSEYSDAVYPYQNYIGPLYVVNQIVRSDSSTKTGTFTQSFWYYGAWTNLQGRGFQSFYGTRLIDSRNGLWYYSYFERAFPSTGMDFEDVLSNNAGAHISVSLRTPATYTLSSTANEERYFPYFSNITTTRDELGGAEDGDPITSTSTD